MLSDLNNNQQTTKPYKIVVKGSRKSGKETLFGQLSKYEVAKNISSRYISHVDFKFGDETNNLDFNFLKLEVIKSQSTLRFAKLFNEYTIQSCAILFIFDVSDTKSFETLKNIVKRTDTLGNNNAIKMLIANKCDLNREISYDEALAYSIENGMIYVEISAISESAVELFLHLLFSYIFI